MRMNDRRVATFIQDMLHLKPHEEHELERPLAFLLPRSEGLPLSPQDGSSTMHSKDTNVIC